MQLPLNYYKCKHDNMQLLEEANETDTVAAVAAAYCAHRKSANNAVVAENTNKLDRGKLAWFAEFQEPG